MHQIPNRQQGAIPSTLQLILGDFGFVCLLFECNALLLKLGCILLFLHSTQLVEVWM